MRDVIIRKEGSDVYLGRQGENNAIRILIPVADLIAEYGTGTFTITNKRTSDKDAYPCTVTQDAYYVYWPITNAETAYKGTGRFQLTYTVDGTIMKSVTYKTVVDEGLSATADPPTPWQGWVDSMIAQVHDLSKVDRLSELIPYSNSTTFNTGTIGKAIQTLENKQLTSEDVSYTSSGTHTEGTIGASVKALEDKQINAGEVSYDAGASYTSGTVGYAIKNVKNDINAGDVTYSSTATYSASTVGSEINSIKSDISDIEEDITEIQENIDSLGAEDISYSSDYAYVSGTAGYAIKHNESEITDAKADITDIQTELSSLGSEDIAYSYATAYAAGTVGKAVKDLEDKVITAGEVTYSPSGSYTSGSIGYAVKSITPVRESHQITTSEWSSIAFKRPFLYSASFTATSTLGTDTEVELICNDVVTFAKYGLCIGAISGQTVTVYSTEVPEENVTVSIDVKG